MIGKFKQLEDKICKIDENIEACVYQIKFND